jgi:hypothetical protein
MTLRKTITDLAEQFADSVLQALRRSSFQDLAALTAAGTTAPVRRRRRRAPKLAVAPATPQMPMPVYVSVPKKPDSVKKKAAKTAKKATATKQASTKTKKAAAKKPGRPAKAVARPAGFESLGFKKAKKAQAKKTSQPPNTPPTITDPNMVLGTVTTEGTFGEH